MITQFRKFAKSPWAFAVVGLIAVSFIFVGNEANLFSALGPQHVIKAGDRSVDRNTFRADFERVRGNYQEQSGQPITFEMLIDANVHVQYLESQAQRLGFLNWAWKVGIRPGKELVLQQIRQAPIFFNQITGKFDEEAYRSILAAEGLTPQTLEQEFRDQYAQNHYAAALYAGVRVPRIYGAVIATGATERRDGRWFAVTREIAGSAGNPTDEQLEAYLKENAARFTRPETRVVSVVLFTNAPGQRPEISEADIQERFEFRKDALSVPERRTFSIYPAANAEAAQRIATALRAGQNPGVEPTAYNQTPKTAVSDPAVAEAAFALTGPGISDPVQGRVGFSVVRVTAIQAGEPATLASVRDAIVAELETEAERRQAFDRVQAYEAARASGQTLEQAVAAVGARIVPMPAFTQDGRRLDGSPLNAPPQIFSTAWELTQGAVSDVVDAGQGQYFVLRLDTIQPSSLIPLAEVRAPLSQEWTMRENDRLMRNKSEELAARVRAGEDIGDVARSVGATLVVRTELVQDQQTAESLGQGLIQGLFGQGKDQVFVQPLSQNAFVVGRVDAIRAAEPAIAAPIAESIRPRISQDVASSLGDSAISAAQARSRATYDVGQARVALGLEPEAPQGAAPGR